MEEVLVDDVLFLIFLNGCDPALPALLPAPSPKRSTKIVIQKGDVISNSNGMAAPETSHEVDRTDSYIVDDLVKVKHYMAPSILFPLAAFAHLRGDEEKEAKQGMDSSDFFDDEYVPERLEQLLFNARERRGDYLRVFDLLLVCKRWNRIVRSISSLWTFTVGCPFFHCPQYRENDFSIWSNKMIMDIVLPVDGTVVSARTLTVYGEYDANLDKVGVAAFAPPVDGDFEEKKAIEKKTVEDRSAFERGLGGAAHGNDIADFDSDIEANSPEVRIKYVPEVLRKEYLRTFEVPPVVARDLAWLQVKRNTYARSYFYNVQTKEMNFYHGTPELERVALENRKLHNRSLKKETPLKTPLEVRRGEVLGLVFDYEFPDISHLQPNDSFPQFPKLAFQEGPLFNVFIDQNSQGEMSQRLESNTSGFCFICRAKVS